MAKRRRKTKTHLKGVAKETGASSSSAPKSFVIRSGKVSTSVGELVSEVRQVMEPNTASRLRERKSNKLRDFLTMCGPLGVSHLLLFSQKNARDAKASGSGMASEAIGNINLRIARAPRGPTVTFRINKFALCRDVAKAQRRARATGGEYNTAPLLVLNNFGSAEKHVKLLVSVFQGLFPPIHVQTMHLSQARRIVLLSYNEESQTIDWRHYLISVRPVGVSRRVRRVIEGSTGHKAALSSSSFAKRIPNLSSTNDISEYLLGSQNGEQGGFETDASSASEADSDVEEGGKSSNHVQLPDSYVGRGNVRDSQRAVRLLELGPRMELRCVKIEEGIPGAGKDAKGSSSNGGNDVLWHDYVKKSSAEAGKQRSVILEKERQRKKRREEQEKNVQRKKEEKAATKTSKRGKPVDEEDGDEDDESVEAPVAEEKDDNDDEDEFAYEDQHGERAPEALFEEDDEAVDAEDSIGEESEGEGESDQEEEDDSDSDLSPIEVDLDEIETASEEEEEKSNKRHKPHAGRH